MSQGVKIHNELLWRARIRKGWSLRKVEARCKEINEETGNEEVKVDFSNLSRYERGTIRPVPRTLRFSRKRST